MGQRRIGPPDEGEVLGAEEHAAVQTDECQPLSFATSPPVRHQICRPVLEMSDHQAAARAARRRRLTPAADIGFPIVHEPTSPLEQVRASMGCLNRVLDSVHQRRVEDLDGAVAQRHQIDHRILLRYPWTAATTVGAKARRTIEKGGSRSAAADGDSCVKLAPMTC